MVATNLDLRLRAQDELRAGLNRAGNQIDRFTRQSQTRFGRIQDTVKGIRGQVNSLIGLFAARAAVRFGRDIVNTADQIGKLSTRLGLSTEFLSEFRFAAERTGVDANTLDLALQRIVRRFGEIERTGRGTALPALQELGSDIVMAVESGTNLEQLLPIIADRLAAIESPARRASIAMQLFDSEGVKLVQTLEGGSEAIEDLRREARELGATITGDQARAAAEFNDEITNLTTSLQGLAREGLGPLLPELTAFSEATRNAIRNVKELRRLEAEGRIDEAPPGLLPPLLGPGIPPTADEIARIRARGRAREQREAEAAARNRFIAGAPLPPGAAGPTQAFPAAETPQRVQASLDAARDAGEGLLFNLGELGRQFADVGQGARDFFEVVIGGTTEWSGSIDTVVISARQLTEVQEGIKIGLDEIAEGWSTVNITAGLVVDTANTVGAALSNSISSFIEGTKTAREAFRDFARGVLRDLQRIIVQALIARAIGALAGAAAGGETIQATGGPAQSRLDFITEGGLGAAPGFTGQNGLIVPPGRTVVATLHGGRTGEAVIPFDRQFSPDVVGGGGGVTQNFFIQALDVKSIDDVVQGSNRRNQSGLTGMVSNNMRNSTRFSAAGQN